VRSALAAPEPVAPDLLECAAATRPSPGAVASGDLAVVTSVAGGALIAAIDGVGTGAEAARAAGAAADVVAEASRGNLVALVSACHEALTGTRGVAMSAAYFAAGERTMTWLGVGNVEGRLVPGSGVAPAATESLPLLAGVLGHDLPPLMSQTLGLERGDLVVFATDGVAASYADTRLPAGSPGEVAEHVITTHARGEDDALVLVVRFRGEGR
jgi:negative regulator of sigma-B (phosphoserine phosphatase)